MLFLIHRTTKSCDLYRKCGWIFWLHFVFIAIPEACFCMIWPLDLLNAIIPKKREKYIFFFFLFRITNVYKISFLFSDILFAHFLLLLTKSIDDIRIFFTLSRHLAFPWKTVSGFLLHPTNNGQCYDERILLCSTINLRAVWPLYCVQLPLSFIHIPASNTKKKTE